MPRCLAAALFAAIVLAAATPPASAASFDCGRAFTALEKAVCQDPRLGDLDARMARNYITLLNRISDSSATAIRADQKTWLKKRDACGDDTRCINREYRARIRKIGQLSATVDRALEKAGLPDSIGKEPMIVRSTDGPIRTTAQQAASPETVRTTAQQTTISTADTTNALQPRSPGLFKRMLSKVAPKLAGGNAQPSASDDLTEPPALRLDQEPRRQSTEPDVTVRRETDLFREATVQRDDTAPARRKVVIKMRKPAIEAPDPAPVALAAPEKKKSKRAKDTDVGEPAVLLYTTPDVSSVIRMPDGESPFDQLDAQGAFDEPPGPPLKVTPRSLPHPAKRAFDASRFDAFDAPNG